MRAFEQAVRIAGGEPAALLGDADRHHIELAAVDGVEDGGGGEQRDLMLAAAPAKEDADAEFFGHCSSIFAQVRAGIAHMNVLLRDFS